MNHEDMEMLEVLEKTKKLALKDIKTIVDKGNINGAAEYKSVGDAIDIIKDAVTTCAMLKHNEGITDEMSGMYPMMTGMNSYGPGGNNMMYDNSGNSYARGRDAMTGRYVSRDMMRPDFDNMMSQARTEQERDFVRRMMG